MKIYRGKFKDGGAGGQDVMVVDSQTGAYALKHICRHSPDGFNWGYGGSGPADLALSILSDCLHSAFVVEAVYQDFKWDFVAKWNHSFEITQNQIESWLVVRIKELDLEVSKDMPPK